MKTVLVVDDQLGTRKIVKGILKDAGYEKIIVCESGEEALSHLGEADILITDYLMGGVNGVELAIKAKRQNPKMLVIIMTGTSRLLPSNHHADSVLEKPFTVNRLLACLERVSQ